MGNTMAVPLQRMGFMSERKDIGISDKQIIELYEDFFGEPYQTITYEDSFYEPNSWIRFAKYCVEEAMKRASDESNDEIILVLNDFEISRLSDFLDLGSFEQDEEDWTLFKYFSSFKCNENLMSSIEDIKSRLKKKADMLKIEPDDEEIYSSKG